MKRKIRLTENDLHNLIKESVRKVLRESKYDYEGYYDEYNEFDRNDFGRYEVDSGEKLFNRVLSGNASKEDIKKVFEHPHDFIYGPDGTPYDNYEYEILQKLYPKEMKRAQNNSSWQNLDCINKEHKRNSMFNLGVEDREGKGVHTYLDNAQFLAADRGYDGKEKFYKNANGEIDMNGYPLTGDPVNDMNLNVYDYGFQSDELANPDSFYYRNTRPTIRGSYNAARKEALENYKKNR